MKELSRRYEGISEFFILRVFFFSKRNKIKNAILRKTQKLQMLKACERHARLGNIKIILKFQLHAMYSGKKHNITMMRFETKICHNVALRKQSRW